MSGRRALILTALIVAALVVVGGLLGRAIDTEVVREGQLLDFTTAEVQHVRIADGLHVYVIPEVPPTVDLLNGLLLFALAGVGLLACALLVRERRDGWMFGLLTVGSAFLSLDEIIGIHDTIGANLRFLADLPGVNSPDDLVFAAFGAIAIAYFAAFRRTISASRVVAGWIATGLCLFAIAAALDVLDAYLDENLIELVSTLCLLTGFLLLAVDRVRLGASPIASTAVGS